MASPIASSAVGTVFGDDHALAGRRDRRPSGPPAARSPSRRNDASASSSDSQIRNRAVGMPWRAMNALANALLDSRRAAAAVGPKSRRPASVKRSAMPRLRGNSGPTTVKSICSRSASDSTASRSVRSIGADTRELGHAGISGRGHDLGRRLVRRRAWPPAHARARRCREQELSCYEWFMASDGVARWRQVEGTISLTLSSDYA